MNGEIARGLLIGEPTVAQRVVRAKRTLAEARAALRTAAETCAARAGHR
jgi:predicted RNA polymerase sigma factor